MKGKDLAYYKANAEEDYLHVPISVLRYISQLEQEQEKKMYSEEDMKKAYCRGYGAIVRSSLNDCFYEWFEQFKNK